MFLSDIELRQLTGYSRASAQLRWLRRNGWKFTVNARGEPIVAVAEFTRQLVGGRAAHQLPNFEALNG